MRLRDFMHGPQPCDGAGRRCTGFWHVVEPATPFLPGWHLDCVAEHLEAVTAGQILRLVINVPPGHCKSLLTCVFWPAWEWSTNPERKWLFGSFDVSLAHRDAQRTINVLRDPIYQEMFPGTRLEATSPAMGHYTTTAKGERFSTSVEGKGTGRHFDRKVIDDPSKPIAVSRTKKALDTAIEWYGGTLATRNTDPKKAVTVLIMQRLHERDLAGYLLDQGFAHLCLPFEFVPRCSWDRGSSLTRAGYGDRRTEEGQILWPGRHTPESIEETKSSLGSHSNQAAQLQQNPTPASGGFFERDWFQVYESLPLDARGHPEVRWFQTWDLADKGSEESHSHVSGTLWAYTDSALYLVAEVNRLMNYPATKKVFAERQGRTADGAPDFDAGRRYPQWSKPMPIDVEEKASGIQLVQEMKDIFPSIHPTQPIGSKEDRARVGSDTVEARLVYLPGRRDPDGTIVFEPWVEDWIAEVVGFPKAAKNDRVDTLTAALERFNGKITRLAENLRKLRARPA